MEANIKLGGLVFGLTSSSTNHQHQYTHTNNKELYATMNFLQPIGIVNKQKVAAYDDLIRNLKIYDL